jgi:RNA polymerase sigma factor (sigma-70 family)
VQDEAGARTALAAAPGPVLGSDPHDFAGLYIRHRTSFISHARRYLRDPRDADEVVQEAFLRLFLALPDLETELQALAYCRRTITNLCIDRYRADARRPRLVALEGATVDELAEDDTGDPVVRAEDAALVREAMAQLPPLHRAALVKREIEEKPLPVIADELDVAEDSVKHLLFRARRTLRRLLAGTSVVPGADAELARGLRPAAGGASSGVAGLLLLALLGLGSGPDLRAVPVVGVDLPDVLGVTAVADAVGDAVRDVVGVVVPESDAGADVAQQRPGRSEGLPADEGSAPTATERGTQPTGGTGARQDTAARQPGAVAGAQPGLPVSGRPTTVVTVVDGVPVVTVVPPTGALPGVDAPVTGGRPVPPGTSTGPGPAPKLPAVTLPQPHTAGRGGPDGTPVGPVLPVAAPPARPSGPGTSVRAPRADVAAPKVAEKAEKAAEKTGPKSAGKAQVKAGKVASRAENAGRPADKAAEKAAQKAQQAAAGRAAAKADQAAQKAAQKAQQAAAGRAAAKADQAAQKAAQQAGKAAGKAGKAAGKAGKAAGKEGKAAGKAGKAAGKAGKAAEKSAGERSAAAVPAGAVPTTAATVPAP